jgi:hypothetical protein
MTPNPDGLRRHHASLSEAFEEVLTAVDTTLRQVGFRYREPRTRERPFGYRQELWERDREMINLCLEGRDQYLSLGFSTNKDLRSPIQAGFVIFECSTRPEDYEGAFPATIVEQFRDAIEAFAAGHAL